MGNDLKTLNDTLHEQLKRVSNLQKEDVDFEKERVKMLTSISKEINQTNRNSIEVLKMVSSGAVHINKIPQQLLGDNI